MAEHRRENVDTPSALRIVNRIAGGVLLAFSLIVLVGQAGADEGRRRFVSSNPHAEASFEGIESTPEAHRLAHYLNAVAELAPGGSFFAVYEGHFKDQFPAGCPPSFDATCVRVVGVPVRSPDLGETARVSLSLIYQEGMKFPAAIFTDPSTTWLAPNPATLSAGTFWEVLLEAPWTATVEMPVEPLESSAIDVLEELWKETGRHPLRSGGQIIMRPRSTIAVVLGELEAGPRRRNVWLCQHVGSKFGRDLRGGYRTMLYVPVQDRGTIALGMSPWR